MQNEEG